MDLGRIAVRVLVVYVYLLAATRLSGKRAISEATPFDFLVSLILGDLIDDALWAEVSMARAGAATASIFVCDAIVKIGSLRSERFRRLAGGRPVVVVRDGIVDRSALRSEQLSDADLQHLLRTNGLEDPGDVHLGVLELDHQLSVVLRPEAEPAQKQDAVRVFQAR